MPMMMVDDDDDPGCSKDIISNKFHTFPQNLRPTVHQTSFPHNNVIFTPVKTF